MSVPDKPALEGLEQKWTERWERDGVFRFDRRLTVGETPEQALADVKAAYEAAAKEGGFL